MLARFQIQYHTHVGQHLKVEILPALALDADAITTVFLALEPNLHTWVGNADIVAACRYRYVLVSEHEGGSHATPEAGNWRWLDTDGIATKATKTLTLHDAWRDANHYESPLYTAAFTNAAIRTPRYDPTTEQGKNIKPEKNANTRFQIRSPRITEGERMALLIDREGNGDLTTAPPVLMYNSSPATDPANTCLWTADLALDPNTAYRYRYGIYNTHTNAITGIEHREDDRWTTTLPTPKGSVQIFADEGFQHPHGNWRGTGVAIPVFALRSERGLGVGEFRDLELLSDWAAATGMKLIQILPINDTSATNTWVDSYPYSGISVYALHPQYLNIETIGAFSAAKTQKLYDSTREKLNALPEIDYDAVMGMKLHFAKLQFDTHGKQHLASPEYAAFFEANESWLVPYAAFCYLRDLHRTADFSRWDAYATFDAEAVKALFAAADDAAETMRFHCFVQYHLHLQLTAAAEYARARSIVLKGDIPIGIYRYSLDAWMQPHLFNMDGQAGAPPDAYSAIGQNWGFPTYNWDEMQRDGFAWWRSRLQHLAQYFDAFRIDHILGFFRIWEIPYRNTYGMMGRFNPAWGIHKNELAARGITADYERLCTPYIREYMLYSHFGSSADFVRHTFFEEHEGGRFRFRDFVDSQRKVENFFSDATNTLDHPTDDPAAYRLWLAGILKELHAEVLLFEAPFSNGEAFHPRIELYRTHSYRDLPAHERAAFDALHYEYFYQKQEPLWEREGRVRLPAVKSATDMLICGEDLGMVPTCVPAVMREQQILSLEIQRMSHDTSAEFGQPAHYPYWSVCSPSCHDMSTVRGWWEEDTARTQRYYNNTLGHFGGAPFFCEPWVVEEVVRTHLHSPSMWAIFPIQDLVGMHGSLRRANPREEQINDPSNGQHYWRYRFHLPLEQLIGATAFNEHLHRLVTGSGR